MRPLLVLLLLTMALVSGCVSEGDVTTDDEPQAVFAGEQFQGAADQGTPASGSSASHGEPQRTDSAVTTGTDPNQLFVSWARQTVTITNDFGGAALGIVTLGLSAGSITVLPGADDGYAIEVMLEAEAETESQARDALAQMTVSHDDELDAEGLHLATGVRYEPVQNPSPAPLPTFQLWNGVNTKADLTMTVPAGPAYDLWASASSGDVSVSDLRGSRFRLDASSGDVSATGINAAEMAIDVSSGEVSLDMVQAAILSADASSGSILGHNLAVGQATVGASSGNIELDGRFADLDASTSSGDITVRAEPTKSGLYELDASSGSASLELATTAGLGYDVSAEVSSGTIDIDLPDTKVLDEDEDGDSKHVQTIGFEALAIQTTVGISTSSGDITVRGIGVESDIL